MKIILGGALGRMGHEVTELALAEGHEIVCRVDCAATGAEQPPVIPDYALVATEADCIVDFSRPSALEALLNLAISRDIPAVLCATGYNEEELAQIERASRVIPILRSANMSLGVNLMLTLCEEAAKALNAFDVEITETHHRNKADAPSGTALLLRDAILKGLGEERKTLCGREGRNAKREDEIGMHSLRGGSVVGEHIVSFLGDGEELMITHRAENRRLFARGALAAADWVHMKESGLYSMQDLVRILLMGN